MLVISRTKLTTTHASSSKNYAPSFAQENSWLGKNMCGTR